MQRTTMQPFRKCHLQILRSLYDDGQIAGSDVETIDRHQDGGEKSANKSLMIHDEDEDVDNSTVDDGGSEMSDDANVKEEGELNKKVNNDVSSGYAAEESPVGNEVWVLIDQFLKRRSEYHPYKERSNHWSKVNDEAKSRIEHLSSISSFMMEEEEKKPLPSILSRARQSLTPRTPTLFSMMGRGTGALGTNLSLTPQSSNRNANNDNKLSQNDIELVSSIPSWNLINQMLQRRSRLCTESCHSFRSQPFLTQLHDEAQMRCNVLKGVLQKLKMEEVVGSNKHVAENNKKREGLAMMMNPARKRQRLEGGTARTSSLCQFFSSGKSTLESTTGISDDGNYDKQSCEDNNDAIMEAQMKLCLWSSLLSSVKEITDESC